MKHQYENLKFILQKKISKGILKPGDILPSENELCATYKIARSTVRQALEELVKDGLVTKRKGKGSVVNEPKRKSLGLFSIKGFSAVVGEMASEQNTIFLEKPHHLQWGTDFFYRLSEDEIALGCICIKRLRMVEGSPVMLEYTYVPDTGLPLLSTHSFVNNSLFETLKVKFGIEIKQAEQELLASGATKEIAKVFKIKPGAPVLHVYRKYATSQTGLFIYSSFFCNTEKYSIGNVFL